MCYPSAQFKRAILVSQFKFVILVSQLMFDHFQALRMARLLSMSFFMTLATAISKSYCVTWMRRSRRANIPASVHTAFDSAPEAPTIFSAIRRRSIPRIRFILREWIFRI